MTAYTAVNKLIDKLKSHGGLTDEQKEKVDVLYLMGKINSDEYMKILDKTEFINDMGEEEILDTVTDEDGNVFAQRIVDGEMVLEPIENADGTMNL